MVQRIGLYLFLCAGQYACRRDELEMGESAKSILPHLCAPNIIPWIGREGLPIALFCNSYMFV